MTVTVINGNIKRNNSIYNHKNYLDIISSVIRGLEVHPPIFLNGSLLFLVNIVYPGSDQPSEYKSLDYITCIYAYSVKACAYSY